MRESVFKDPAFMRPLSEVAAAARAEYERRFSPNELRARRHVVFTFLIEHCLERVAGGLYKAPSEIAEVVLMGEIVAAFGIALRGVPGFFYSVERGFWKLNTAPDTFLEPYFDGRGYVAGFYVRRGALDKRPTLLTSKGLPLGTEAVKPT